MAITIFGRGWPLSAEVSDAKAIFTVNVGNSMAITSGGIMSATDFSGTNIKATTATATTFSGATFSGAVATSGGGTEFTFTGGGSAVTSGGTVVVSGDRFLKVIQGGKTFYVACYASASTCSALA